MLLHADARGRVQVAGAGVVAQAGPLRQHFVERGGTQVLQGRKGFQEAGEVGNHLLHLGLLEHDLRQPHAVGRAWMQPGQVVAAGLVEPGQQVVGETVFGGAGHGAGFGGGQGRIVQLQVHAFQGGAGHFQAGRGEAAAQWRQRRAGAGLQGMQPVHDLEQPEAGIEAGIVALQAQMRDVRQIRGATIGERERKRGGRTSQRRRQRRPGIRPGGQLSAPVEQQAVFQAEFTAGIQRRHRVLSAQCERGRAQAQAVAELQWTCHAERERMPGRTRKVVRAGTEHGAFQP